MFHGIGYITFIFYKYVMYNKGKYNNKIYMRPNLNVFVFLFFYIIKRVRQVDITIYYIKILFYGKD